jgi:hypothetical protein
MIFQIAPLITPARSHLLRERQAILRELHQVNHQIALQAGEMGLTIKEAIKLAREEA